MIIWSCFSIAVNIHKYNIEKLKKMLQDDYVHNFCVDTDKAFEQEGSEQLRFLLNPYLRC